MDEKLYLKSKDRQTRWASFENPKGEKGAGGAENGKAKGRAFRPIEPGESRVLMETDGSGTVDRLWLTLMDREPAALRSLKLEMFWDGSEKPAVSVPLGDFFCVPFGMPDRFESVFLSSPEGRSFNSFFKMPFLQGAKIVLTNESKERVSHLFYDVNYTLCPMEPSEILYFHAFWNRENPNKLTEDYTVLPRLAGQGKFIGMSVGVICNEIYGDSWFGEGEVKIYLDGDRDYPTLCGTGTEDYIGTGWGQGEFANLSQGCLTADKKKRRYAFYRFHAPDPVYFYDDIAVRLQAIGGCYKYDMMKLIDSGAPNKIVTRDEIPPLVHLYETDFVLGRDSADGWYNYYRQDDFSSTAYFYLDRPSTELPSLPEVAIRTEKV